MKTRIRIFLVLSLAALAAAIPLSGCGGGDGGGGTSADPATLAPSDAPLFIEATVRPEGELKSNLESLAEKVAGISDPGTLIIDRLDSSLADADTDEKLTYQDDIEPWLGEEAGIYFSHYDGDDFTGVAGVIQTTDSDAAADFVEKVKESGDKDASYEGVDYVTGEDGGTTAGVIDDFLVLAQDEQTFKDAVDASGGDSLDGNETYSSTVADLADNSIGHIYVDIGGLIRQAGPAVDQQVLQFYSSLGYDVENSTALASLVPGSDQVEVDVSADLGGPSIGSGDVTDLIGSFPADSIAAVATPDVGTRLKQVIDQLDETGIPPDVPPGALKSTLARQGIDLDKISSALGDVGVFAEGSDLASIGAAVVSTTSDPQVARDAIDSIGTLLRRSNAKGYTPVTGNAVGFAFRNAGLGRKPLVVLASGDRIAVGYGVDAAQAAVSAPSGEDLASSEVFQRASDALGDTNITGFIDIASAVDLIEGLGAGSELEQVRPYVDKLDFLSFGYGTEGDRSITKFIVALKQG
jgi:hypothetical protein